ncbi:osmoprotectant transport system ATP-binding protein [Sinomonas atrocyanea]|uniref:ABC transporter ATP-binding protein n=1 Tax=Sinomonas atrocyanea TaxID=37927 RepID=UPI00277FCEE7|nr:ABC transporter ATP-binding protein [Sinomonas atrocyanea]MDP9885720.1 osmoprotectant transport system ATP-binding protein [Sinomonas atrocyanea]
MSDPMIEFHEVSKVYGGLKAVDRLSLSVPRGQITVFVGPSGCGKTTSLRMVNRMVEPSSGTITVDGRDVAAEPAPLLRRSMGYVMQAAGLMPHRTVVDNIATVPRLNGVSRAAARARARELLDVVGLPQDLGGRYPAQLSGGQQQRVGVARALAADPPVLLMDEPFSAVDPVVRHELQQELVRLQRDLGKTIVFVTHDIDEAVLLGDRIAVFAVGGRLAQVAAPEELLRAPADDFVSGFVGRDRGFRHLGFYDDSGLAVEPAETIRAADVPSGRADEWAVALGADGRPVGWAGPAFPGTLVSGGSLHRAGSTLRSALDAALSSPSGRGVVVDDTGRLLGTVGAAEVIAHADRRRTESQRARAAAVPEGGA